MPAMTGAERVRKHRERLYQEREAKIRAIWNPSRLPGAERARLLDWLARADAADVVSFLGNARGDWHDIFAPPGEAAPLREAVTPDAPDAPLTPRPKPRAPKPRKRLRRTKFVKLFEPWLGVLDLERWADLTEMEVTAAFREKAKAAHPDHGGSDGKMQRLNRARGFAMLLVRHARGERISYEELKEAAR
jgi:hypothetical protein